MIEKEGNDPSLYTITRKSTIAKRQSSNQSSNGSSSSSLYNNFHNSPLMINKLDEENEFEDDDYQDLRENQTSYDNYVKFDKTASLTTDNLSKLNLAANYLNQKYNQFGNSSVLNENAIKKRNLLNKKHKLNKQLKRNSKNKR